MKPLSAPVQVTGPAGPVEFGTGRLVVIAGPCMLESRDLVLDTARECARVCAALELPLVFKGSYLKANRTSDKSPSGPGLVAGLQILSEVRASLGIPILTDVHTEAEAEHAGRVVDVLQVPAFLCRQSSLLQACGRTGKVVNIKKGQFAAAPDLLRAADKATRAGASGVLLTERGNFFGYGDLVVDFRNLARLRAAGHPVVFDVSHSLQRPSGADGITGGERAFAPAMARAAAAFGVDALFVETHPDPDRALSDSATQWPLSQLEGLLLGVLRASGSAP